MNKELFIQFIEILDRKAEHAGENQEYQYSENDFSVLQQLKALAGQDQTIKDLLYDIGASSSKEERCRKVEDFFNKSLEEKNVDELLAEAHGVDVTKIDHRYLSNGHEILSFYSNKLDRMLFLRVDSDGKNVKEYLENLQKEKGDSQESSAESTLMDERNSKDIELKWYDKKDLAYLHGVVDSMDREQDLKKFKYLIELLVADRISCINLEEFIYRDNQDRIGEVSLVDGEIMDMAPADENYQATQNAVDKDFTPPLEDSFEPQEKEGEKEETSEHDEVEEMMRDDEMHKNVEEAEHGKEDEGKAYVYQPRDSNSNGYGTIVIFAIVISVFIIGVILYLVFH